MRTITVSTAMRDAFIGARDRAAMQMNPTRFTRQGVNSIGWAERHRVGEFKVPASQVSSGNDQPLARRPD